MKNRHMAKAVKFASQIDQKVLKDLKLFVKDADRSISSVVTEAVQEYLERARVRPAFKSAVAETIAANAELLKQLAK